MPKVIWYEEGRVLYVRHPVRVDDDTVIAWNMVAADMLAPYTNAPQRIHIIIDTTRVQEFAVNAQVITQSEVVQQVSKHPRLGWGVYLGSADNVVYKFVATIAGQRLDENLKFFDTEAEVVDFLKRQDPELSALEVKDLSRMDL